MTAIAPARTGSYPLRAGNRVRPLIDGEPAFRRICEAVEAARRRVWVTIAFVDHDAQLPDGRGTVFDVLDRAAARGLDVRVLFWREPELASLLPDSEHFAGTDAERKWLRERGARFRARWDHLPHYCHHQKSWVLDAGEAGELAFVGGINLDRGSIVVPGHPPRPDSPSVHDLFVEVAGPASTDVAHNFVQRWNEASERDRPDGCWPDADVAGPLPFPSQLAPPSGEVPVQIARTIRPGIYTAGVAAPDAAPFPIAAGESSILEQYLAAIDGAREGIYIENQFLGAPSVLEHLALAVARDVEVVFVLPGMPMDAVRDTRARGGQAALFFEALAALGERPNFTLRRAGVERPDRRHAPRVRAREDDARRRRLGDHRLREHPAAVVPRRCRAERVRLAPGDRSRAANRSAGGASRARHRHDRSRRRAAHLRGTRAREPRRPCAGRSPRGTRLGARSRQVRARAGLNGSRQSPYCARHDEDNAVGASFDLLIRGGTLVDGTGAPGRRGDVGIRDGRIAALGDVSGDADRVLDADGAVVAPGFVDIHTHYDAQVFWDRMLTHLALAWRHQVVMGNCGFGVAPTRPAHRELVLRTLERVEGMSLDALLAGVGRDWPFETFPEFLDRDRAPRHRGQRRRARRPHAGPAAT